jgi:hypothetical protein
MKETTDFYRMASEFYLCAPLPQDYEEMDCDDFNTFLEENAWQPFEGWSGDDMNKIIEGLSYKMENIERETRKNTLDEVRAALNIQ